MRTSYAWAPETVRHLFRQAGYGACKHGVTLYRAGDLSWASACQVNCGGREPRSNAQLFVLGHHREVPKPSTPFPDEAAFLDYMKNAPAVEDDRVRRAIPSQMYDLAIALGVQSWGSSPIGNGFGAVGYILGMAVCAISPWATHPHALAPRRAA